MKKIILSGDVGWEISVERIREQLKEAEGDDLDVQLASPGGSVFDGIEIFNLFRDYKREYPAAQMMLTIKGEAASIASYIAVNPAWDLIAAEDNAVFMIHNAWGAVIGDYRETAKMSETLDGLTGIIAKAYMPRMKKTLSEVRSFMDNESWYFGEELKSAGFVDEIIKTEAPKERVESITSAKLKFSALSKKMQAMTKTEILQIAAMIRPDAEQKTEQGNTPAADAGKNIKEVNAMTLTEFLASDPTAKAEYNAALEQHGKIQFDAGVKSVQDRIAGAMPFLKPESEYPGPIRALAVDCIGGKVDQASLRAAVATFDSLKEKQASDAAAQETGEQGDTHGQQVPTPSADGKLNNEVDLVNAINKAKAEKGMEV